MKTVAITIGVGPVYESLANWSASLVQSYLGIETRIVSSNHLTYSLPNVPHPKNIWTLKFSLFDIFPDVDRVMYFDCDWRPVRKFNLDDYCSDLTKLYFVPDRGEYREDVACLSKSYGIDPQKYFNGGWFVASRQAHSTLFQECKEKYHQLINVYGDQCVMNQILKNHVTLLPRKINTLDFGVIPAKEILGFHNISAIKISQKKLPDYNWESNDCVSSVLSVSKEKDYSSMRSLDYYLHPWVPSPDHIFDLYQYAKEYAGLNALEIGSFLGHGTYALCLAGLHVRSCDYDKSYLPHRRNLCLTALFSDTSVEEELECQEKYAVIFYNSYNSQSVHSEVFELWRRKLMPGGLLMIYNTGSFDVKTLIYNLGNPMYKNTFDEKNRSLGFFWKPTWAAIFESLNTESVGGIIKRTDSAEIV